MSQDPFQIIAGPFEVYLAPVGEAFPDTDEAPTGNWTKIGTGGAQDYSEDGITIVHGQDVNEVRTLGSSGPRKVFRRGESLQIRFTLLDMTLEMYRYAIAGATVTDTAAGAGTPGERDIDLYMGPGDIQQWALLCRGDNISGYGDTFSTQYEVPVVIESGSKEVVVRKGEPTGLALEFTALEDPNAATSADRFGKLVMQDATAS